MIADFVFMVFGLLIKKYPNLIAGFNSHDAEVEEKVTINKMIAYIEATLITAGVLILLRS